MNRVSKLVAYLRIVFFRENTRFVLNLLCNTIIFTRNSRNSEFWVLNREKTTQNSKVDYWVVVELSTQRQLTIEFKKRVNKPTDEIQFLKIQNPKKIGKILSNAKIKEFLIFMPSYLQLFWKNAWFSRLISGVTLWSSKSLIRLHHEDS